MKKTIFTRFAAATLILAATACQKDNLEGGNAPQSQENLVPMTITASLEADTKAALQEGGKVFWEKGDALTVLAVDEAGNQSASYEFTTEGEGEKAEFTGMVGQETGMYAVYPNNDDKLYPYIAVTKDDKADGAATANVYWKHTMSSGNVSMFLPSLQKANSTKGLFRAISAGVVDEENKLMMKNVGGLIAVDIPVADVESVILYGNSGEMITGTLVASFSESGDPVVSSVVGGNVIRMIPATGTTFAVGKYYVNLPPVTFSNGLTLIYTKKSDSTFAVVRSTGSFVVERSKISTLPSLPTLKFGGKILKIISRRDTRSNSTNLTTVPPNTTTGTHTYTFKYPEDSEEKHNFIMSGTGRVGRNTGYAWGIIWGGASGDYVEFPAIEGYALSKVMMITGQITATIGNPVMTDASGVVHNGCLPWEASIKPQGIANIWSFAGAANTPYRLSTTTTSNCSAQQIHLYYADAPEGVSSVNPLITNVENLEPEVDYPNNKITMYAAFSAVDYSSLSQFTCGFDYKLSSDPESEWSTLTCDTPELEFSAVLSPASRTTVSYRPWVSFVKTDGSVKTVYGKEAVIDLKKIVLNLVFNDSYWDKTAEGRNANFLAREWGWSTNQNNSSAQKPALGEMNGKSYDFNYLGEAYPFTFYSLQGIYYDKSGESTLSPGGYTLRVASGSQTTYGLCMNYINPDTFDGPYPAWMQFPGIEKFKLTQVNASIYSKQGFKIASAVVTDEAAADTVRGTAADGAVLAEAKSIYNATLDLEEKTNAGQRYYLCTTQNRVTFKNLTLTYEFVSE